MADTLSSTLTRPHRGGSVPRAGLYDIDRTHSAVEFVARHLMVSRVRGRFTDFSGTVIVAEEPEQSHVEVTIATGSITTNEPARDAHLRSADFFDVENHPTAEFRSTAVEHVGGEHWKVTGDLTLHGVTRPVVLDVEFAGATPTPFGTNAIGFTATTEIDREDWGLTWNAAVETGGVVVGKRVRIEIEVEASQPAEAG